MNKYIPDGQEGAPERVNAAPPLPRHWHDLYIDFQADPLDIRTDKQFCEEIQLAPQTLANWKVKYRPYIFREVEARRKSYASELRSKGHKALSRKLDKDTNAIKLLFQLLGDLVERTESKVEMSDADKLRRIEALRKSTSSREKAWTEAESNSESNDSKLSADSTDGGSKL